MNQIDHVHDNTIYAYLVQTEAGEIILFTQTEGNEFVDVIFKGVTDHMFEHVREGNIILAIDEVVPDLFLAENRDLFAGTAKFGWPALLDRPDPIAQILDRGLHIWLLNSSYGMAGWIISETAEVHKRHSKFRH